MPAMQRRLLLVLSVVLFVATPRAASAFCGFYVGGADADLFNNASQVVLMREGTRTVLSIQNNYTGPLSDFALVIPVPTILRQSEVKTLDKEIFDHVDRISSPRLVEYEQTDPCNPIYPYSSSNNGGTSGGGVRVEAQFKVGEYEITILGASESAALDRWLRANRFNIPEGAQSLLDPYVEQGFYFFVARVITSEVQFDGDRAVLSPLRFYYDSPHFFLPIRLGLLNADTQQDLIVHILALEQRYEVANRTNIPIPTNLRVTSDVKSNFGGFYTALFDHALEQHPDAVVTEYSWAAASCDPCPGPTLSAEDLATLGNDVLGNLSGWNHTRLHARYRPGDAVEDLVFRAAPPIIGGRGYIGSDELAQTLPQPSSANAFQARYIIENPWLGETNCESPVFDAWNEPQPQAAPSPNTTGERASAQTENLEDLLLNPIPDTSEVESDDSVPLPRGDRDDPNVFKSGCAVTSVPTYRSATIRLLSRVLLRR